MGVVSQGARSADSPDKLESWPERPLSDAPRNVPSGFLVLLPTATSLGRAAWPCQLRPTDTGAPSHAAPGRDAAPPVLPCSLDGGSGGGWSVGPVAAGVLVIGCAAHAREPLGRARRRWARRIGGQPEVRQDLLDHRPLRTPEASGGRVLDRCQQTQPPAAVGAGENVNRENSAQQVSPCEIARPYVGGRRRSGFRCGARRAVRRRRRPARRVLDDDRAAVAAPARGEGACASPHRSTSAATRHCRCPPASALMACLTASNSWARCWARQSFVRSATPTSKQRSGTGVGRRSIEVQRSGLGSATLLNERGEHHRQRPQLAAQRVQR